MSMKQKRPNLSGCPKCGGHLRSKVGMMTCDKCGYVPEQQFYYHDMRPVKSVPPSHPDRLDAEFEQEAYPSE